MATKKPLESPAKMKARHIETLLVAIYKLPRGTRPLDIGDIRAHERYAELRAAVKAAYPGRQRNAKLVKELDAAPPKVAKEAAAKAHKAAPKATKVNGAAAQATV